MYHAAKYFICMTKFKQGKNSEYIDEFLFHIENQILGREWIIKTKPL